MLSRSRVLVLAAALLAPAALATPSTSATGSPRSTTRSSESAETRHADPVRGRSEAARGVPWTGRAAYPQARTFTLHSKPGSQRTIFLDFDGATVAGTRWNEEGLPDGSFRGWSLDADRASFSATEHAFVQQVFQIVAEDYAPFDVDVTTEDPGEAAITRSGPDDQVFGTRALMNDSDGVMNDVCGTCAGVAFGDAFDAADDHVALQPAWIFTHVQSDDSPKPLAETISHEVGHQFGLLHDGFSSIEYFSGFGNWAPIMGSSDGAAVSQWSDGGYDGASQTQDDIALIAANGAPLEADEAGGTVAAAAVPSTSPALITTRGDVDVWALGSCSGEVQVLTSPAALGPNLDIELTVLDASGAMLAKADPESDDGDGTTASGMGARLQLAGSGAELFAAVDGTGLPGTYDDYGSVGAYTLGVSGCANDVGTVAERPGRPDYVQALPGRRGGKITAGVSWDPPLEDGGSPLTGYVVVINKIRSNDTVASSKRSELLSPDTSRISFVFKKVAYYEFEVIAVNAVGEGLPEASGVVRAI